ncbi:MAG: DNA gyrase subunit A [Negativibacillus sp.]
MAKKKTEGKISRPTSSQTKAYIENAGVVLNQQITDTLESNYMPYAMSVIVSRAIPEIDGFKPSHRKLLYTMYKMGLLTGQRTKSANIVGQTMKLNPHGDGAIYETMVRLSRGNEALLHPYVDSKGNFGKAYSHDMAYAASRYTEAKLDPISAELFRDIDKDTVDFVDNYDNTMKEPALFPVTFPSILVNANLGIAVGMACNICSFNLEEVCNTTIELIKNPAHDISLTLKAPDFAGGGQIIYHPDEMEKIYETGRGSFKVRARYRYDQKSNCLEITEIPPTTTTEAIMDKVVELVKAGKLKEISDMRDETDLSGLKLAIDLKRNTDPDKLMQKLYRFTPLEDSFSCNFNVLIEGTPRVLGVRALLEEWIAFRTMCVKRRVYYDLDKKKEKLHLLEGLEKILLDIDKAIQIVRETKEEQDVVPNLMIGFGIDQVQAEYVAEIKLRQLNREYILKRTKEIEDLKADIAELEAILGNDKKVKSIIIGELKEVIKKYGQPRRSLLIYKEDVKHYSEEEQKAEEYPVHLFFTKEGYFKKITPQSYRMSSEQYLKDGDAVLTHLESSSGVNLLFFTDRGQVYKSRANEFDDTKASTLGDFVPVKLGMDEGESARFMVATSDYQGFLLFFFENGKVAKVSLKAYETKTNRRKLINAYNTKAGSPLVAVLVLTEEQEILMSASGGRILIFHTGSLLEKTTKDNQGVQVMTLKKGDSVEKAVIYSDGMVENPHRYMAKSLPSRGGIPPVEQLTLDGMEP